MRAAVIDLVYTPPVVAGGTSTLVLRLEDPWFAAVLINDPLVLVVVFSPAPLLLRGFLTAAAVADTIFEGAYFA